MTEGKFHTSIKEAESLLKKFNLLKSIGHKKFGQYSDEFLKTSKKNDIVKTYKCAIENRDYNLLLIDDSIMQFRKDKEELRYAFIQNPYTYVSKENYISIIFSPEELNDQTEISVEQLIDDNEYEQFLNEQKLNSISNYFRYDYSRKGYFPLIHSCSHMHIGQNENVRIPIAKILTPLKFTKFCIKNTYFDEWKMQFKNNPDFTNEVINMKNDCIALPENDWKDLENNDLHLF